MSTMENRIKIDTANNLDTLNNYPVFKHTAILLKRWKGKHMRLFGLTNYSRRISIKLSENSLNEQLPYLKITCIEPIFIQGCFEYKTNDIDIKFNGSTYTIYDKLTKFELQCKEIEVIEVK